MLERSLTPSPVWSRCCGHSPGRAFADSLPCAQLLSSAHLPTLSRASYFAGSWYFFPLPNPDTPAQSSRELNRLPGCLSTALTLPSFFFESLLSE